MTANQYHALALALGRVVTIVFVFLVARLQWRLIRQNKGPKLQVYRIILFSLSVILLLGNIFPLLLDIKGIFGKGSFLLLVLYVDSNAITALLAAVMMYYLYHRTRND